jgi:hypothetical protein
MNELSRMSRDALVSELVAPVCAVSDATMAYCAADDTPASQAEIARRLAIAREILLRDLEAQCRRTAVLDSGKTIRELLILHYGGRLRGTTQSRRNKWTQREVVTLHVPTMRPPLFCEIRESCAEQCQSRNATRLFVAHPQPTLRCNERDRTNRGTRTN